jgi:hypothetical protein
MSDLEPLTDDEGQVAADLWAARMGGFAAAVKPEYLPAAHTLAERGWLERRWHGDDMLWWFTDTGLAALDLNALRRNDPADLN